MIEVLADDPEGLDWPKRNLDDEDLSRFARVLGCGQERRLMVLIGSDVVFAYPNLPGSMGWLTVSAFDRRLLKDSGARW